MPRLSPALARSRSCTSWSGSAFAIRESSPITTSSGTGRPSRRPSSPVITSATSAFVP